MKAVIYRRVSTEGQAGDEHVSLDTQETACRRYAEQEGWHAVKTYTDVDSGTNPNREQYQRMLADALAGQFDAIVVYSSSRWGRDAGEAKSSYDALETQGVLVRSTQGEMGNFYSREIMNVVQEGFSRDLSHTVRNNLHRVAERGDWAGAKIAFGYRREYTPDGKTKRIVVDDADAVLVRGLFEYAASGASLSACARWMLERGHPISQPSVKGLLTNPFYISKVRWLDPSAHIEMKAAQSARLRRKRERHVYDGNHPAIINQTLWELTQTAVTRRLFHRQRANEALSASMVFCGHCEGRAQWYRVHWKPKSGGGTREYAYYRCSPNNKHRKGEATEHCNWALRADALDTWFRAQLCRLTVDEDSLTKAAQLLDEQRAYIVAEHEAERRGLQGTLELVRQRQSRLTDMLLDGTVTKEHFGHKSAEFEQRIHEVEKRLTEHRPGEVPDYTEIVKAMRQLPEALARGDRHLRGVLMKLVQRIEVRDKSDVRLRFVAEGLLGK